MNSLKSRQPNTSPSINCGNVSDSYNNVWNNCDISVTDERRQILEWLSPLAPRLRHRDVRRSRVEGVGDRLLQSDEFIDWKNGEDGVVSPVLFGYGDPGAGKTYLSSLVVQELCDQSDGKHVAVACLYCDFYAHKEQSATSMLGAILKQVVSGWGHVPREIEAAFQRSKTQLDGLELESAEILKLLTPSLHTLQRSYICIDGLDEFPREHRPELLKSLRQVIGELPGARLFLTGRPHIWDEIRRYFTRYAKIRIKLTEEDIKKYIIMRLSNDTQPEAMNPGLREEILRKIPEKISDIFLLVSLSVDAILAQSTISRRRKTLQRMTNGLEVGDAYAETLERIRAQDGDRGKLGIEALMWISQSEGPLHAEELRHALSIEKDSADFDPDNVPELGTILSCCLGLVTMGERGSRVRLIHLTLQEYLDTHPEVFGNAHSVMAEACLTYLNFQSIKDLPTNLRVPTKTAPFLRYASCYWGTHARMGLTGRTRLLMLQLLPRLDRHVSARMLLVNLGIWPYHLKDEHEHPGSGFTGLHAIAYFGIADMALIKSQDWEANGKDIVEHTPLLWAVRNNNEGVCRLLLGLGNVDPEFAGWGGRTPLLVASEGGHESIVKLLLERKEVNPGSCDSLGQTPLSAAAWGGHEGIVKLILEHTEANPGSSDHYGQTPLWAAAWGGHEGVVKLLLGHREVNPDSSDKHGRTPLSGASRNGHEGIVKLLLECKEVNPDSSDEEGRTPLSRVASRYLAPEFRENHRANEQGVVTLFLQRKNVRADSRDKRGRTPLSWASEVGCEGMTRLLLERNDVKPNRADNDGQTPLMWATKKGREGIVKLLLEHPSANPKTQAACDEKTRSPDTRPPGNTPAQGITPDLCNAENSKRQSQILGDDWADPLNRSRIKRPRYYNK